MGIVLIYVEIYVIIQGRVIACPSISNTEDMAVTCTLGREGATDYQERKWEELILGCTWYTLTSSNVS